MPEKPTTWKYELPALGFVFGAWLLYAALSLLSPVTGGAKYHMTSDDFQLLRLTIIIPTLIIWMLAVRGAIAFKNYASLITGGQEHKGVNLMADGLLWLVAYLIVSALLSALDPFVTSHAIANSFIVIRDHIPPLFGLVGFLLLYYGSNQLKSVAKFQTWTWTWDTMLIMALFAIFAIGFVLDFSSTAVMPATGAMVTSTSIVPLKVLLFTLVLPYLIAWFVGILAAINIYRYSQNVSGILYRRALRSLVWGIVTVVLFASAVQLTNFADRFLSSLSLGALLAIVYIFIIFYALGFVFIWMGAKQLKRLEALE